MRRSPANFDNRLDIVVDYDAPLVRLIMQLRLEGITDTGVLAAIERIPRQAFVSEALQHRAWDNEALPIERGQTISQPYIVAYMTEALRLDGKQKVLEVGTGSGYQAAILSQLSRRVYTIERHRPLMKVASDRFAALNLHNIVQRHGDGYAGWAEQGPFDRIIVTAAAPETPETLLDQLAPGGIMIVPVDDTSGTFQHLRKYRRLDDGKRIREEQLLPVRFVPMVPGLAPEQHSG